MIKKILVFLIIGLMTFSLFGCSDAKQDKELEKKEKELVLKEKELMLKEKELALKEKELTVSNDKSTNSEERFNESDKKNVEDKKNSEEKSEEVIIQPEKMILSAKQQKEINIFLSNFTETFFDGFTKTPSNEQLIDFGVRHNDINNYKLIKTKENNGYLNKSHVERSVKKYFDLSVKHEKTEAYGFDGNNYIIQLADGEMLPMAVVSKMYDNKDGTYTAYFYEVYSDLLDYNTTPEKIKEKTKEYPEEISMGDYMKAVVSRHDFEGKKIYKLLEYSIVE